MFLFLATKPFILPELLQVKSPYVDKANKPTLMSGMLFRMNLCRSCFQLSQMLRLQIIILRHTGLGRDSWFHFNFKDLCLTNLCSHGF